MQSVSLMSSEVSEDSGLDSNTSRSTPTKQRLQRHMSNKKRRKQKSTPHSRRKSCCAPSSPHRVLLIVKKKLDRGRTVGLNSLSTALKNFQERISRQRISSSVRYLVSNNRIGHDNNRFCLHMAVSTFAALVGNVFLGGGIEMVQAAQFGAASALSVLATETIMKSKRRRNRPELEDAPNSMTMDEVMDAARWQSSEK